VTLALVIHVVTAGLCELRILWRKKGRYEGPWFTVQYMPAKGIITTIKLATSSDYGGNEVRCSHTPGNT